MVTFIANQIIKARKIGLTEGQKKYKAYFVNTHIYENYRADVETILTTDGYADAIVTA